MLSTTALWRPRDASGLTGLTDLYEVVGRFSFQGEDDANLKAMSTLTTSLRAEVFTAVPSLARDIASKVLRREVQP